VLFNAMVLRLDLRVSTMCFRLDEWTSAVATGDGNDDLVDLADDLGQRDVECAKKDNLADYFGNMMMSLSWIWVLSWPIQ
jgi:hypothetical protein